MEIVSKTDIQEYAKRNTSPKMPIESKYVEAYVDSILNSTSLQEVYENIKEKIQAKDQFLIFNSYWSDASNLNSEPYRSILAYAMLKKDFFLFQLIAYNLFTGTVQEFFGDDLFNTIVENTDEHPMHYTDEGAFTDMGAGTVIVGFKNTYSPEIIKGSDGNKIGSQFQSEKEYEESLVMFTSLITMVKPARTNIIIFHIPYCFLGGNENTLETVNVYTDEDGDGFFSSPFKNPQAVLALRNLSLHDLYNTYKTVIYGDSSIPGEQEQEISYERTIIENNDQSITFRYEIRMNHSTELSRKSRGDISESDPTDETDKTGIWNKHIIIQPGDSSKVRFVSTVTYREDIEYYEGYRPILLRISDDPDAPLLPFKIYENGNVNEDPEIAALLYTRYKATEDN